MTARSNIDGRNVYYDIMSNGWRYNDTNDFVNEEKMNECKECCTESKNCKKKEK